MFQLGNTPLIIEIGCVQLTYPFLLYQENK